jgi:HEAT repeat protein
MRMRQVDRAGQGVWAGQAGRAGRANLLFLLGLCLFAAPPTLTMVAAQVSFEQAIGDLNSPDAGARLRAATLLKASSYPEAAIPLAKALSDPQDEIQLEAIAAELNIFLANKIVPKKRVGLVIEVRNRIAAESAFSTGPLALGTAPVPMEVLTALRTAARDDNPRVGLEALYAFGALASSPAGAARRELQQSSSPELSAMVGARDEALRAAAVRVIGRLFEAQASNDEADTSVGDAIITVLNDKNRLIKRAAMDTLGAMRYGRGVDALTQLVEFFKHGELAEAAFDALARIGHPTSVPLFTSQLAAKAPGMRAIAVEGLARVGDSSQMTAIEAALKGERSDAVIFAGTFAAAMLADGPIEGIADALLRPKAHDMAKQYLTEIARVRIDRLGRYAQDPDPGMRADIADILGVSGDAAALPVIEALVKDQDKQVALSAERASARLIAAH